MIIFDLDGTLADCEQRRHFVDKSYITCGINCTSKSRCLECLRKLEKDQPDWRSFFENCNNDIPIWPVVRVIESLHLNEITFKDQEIEIWSGRCESVRDKTRHWLKYIIGEHTYSTLKMRPIGDYTPDEQLKEKWLDEALKEGKKIDFVFDDRPKVVRMWRRRGIFVFDVNQSGKEF